MLQNACPKPRPRVLAKRDRKLEDERVYRDAHDAALVREGRRCQLCGKPARQTHHLRKRSLTRGMAPTVRHEARLLLVVCGWGGQDGCHGLCESKVVKVYGTALKFTCERYDDEAKDWLQWVPPAKKRRAA
jgi:hypothetical protein